MHISVALCTYNGERFIAQQLESIIKQSFVISEIVIVDDCSSDKTISIIKNIVDNSNIAFKFIQNDFNIGAISSFEKCINNCSGDIIFLSDQDDIWLPEKVRNFLDVFEHNSNDTGELLDATLWSKWGFNDILRSKWQNNKFAFNELLLNRNKITGATLAFRSNLKSLLIPFELPSSYWHDAWIGLIASGLNGLKFIERPTILYRVHQSQQVGISGVGYDRKYSPISNELFLNKVNRIFPSHKYIIYPVKDPVLKIKNIINVIYAGLRRFLNIN